MLFAAEEERAINLLLPRIQADLDASIDDLRAVSEAFADTGEGEVVDLGADGPGAAARIVVDGAGSAVLYVPGGDSEASPGEVAEVPDHLLDEL